MHFQEMCDGRMKANVSRLGCCQILDVIHSSLFCSQWSLTLNGLSDSGLVAAKNMPEVVFFSPPQKDTIPALELEKGIRVS